MQFKRSTSTGAMGSITRGPNFRDGSAMIAVTKSIRSSTGSVMEVTPLVKLYCMILSLNKNLYKTEIIPKRVVRCVKTTTYIGREIQPRVEMPVIRCVAVALDTYTKFMINKSPPICHDAFQYGEADQQWTAIPMNNRIITIKRSLGIHSIILTIQILVRISESRVWWYRGPCCYGRSSTIQL